MSLYFECQHVGTELSTYSLEYEIQRNSPIVNFVYIIIRNDSALSFREICLKCGGFRFPDSQQDGRSVFTGYPLSAENRVFLPVSNDSILMIGMKWLLRIFSRVPSLRNLIFYFFFVAAEITSQFKKLE